MTDGIKQEAEFKTKINEDGTLDEVKKEKTEAEKLQEAKMEKIVIFAREVLMPVIKKADKNLEKSKILLDTMAVAIQQGMHEILAKTMVKELTLKKLLKETQAKNPDAGVEDFILITEACEEYTMQEAVEGLQWLASKIDAEVKNLVKDKPFSEVVKDF